jgi:hypothetical protein
MYNRRCRPPKTRRARMRLRASRNPIQPGASSLIVSSGGVAQSQQSNAMPAYKRFHGRR